MNFYSKIKNIQLLKESMICVGLDTVSSDIDSYERNTSIIRDTYDLVCAYKLNLAHYLFDGVKGIDNLLRTVDYIHNYCNDIIVIADCKFGDIFDTNQIYRNAIFDTFQFDAITVNPFCGIDDLIPWFKHDHQGIFVWASSSSDGRKDIQDLVFEKIISSYTKQFSQNNNLGFVIGAGNLHHLSIASYYSPNSILLLPGVGYQGSDLSKLNYVNKSYGINNTVIINSGRQIICSDSPRNETIALKNQINITLNRS